MAAFGSIPGDEPPQMIEIDAVGAIAILFENRSMMPYSAASGHGPRSSASRTDAASACSLTCLKIRLFQTFAITASAAIVFFFGRDDSQKLEALDAAALTLNVLTFAVLHAVIGYFAGQRFLKVHEIRSDVEVKAANTRYSASDEVNNITLDNAEAYEA